ncbi:Uncharacterized protein APZ42_031287 [Daphnia magna]|uniref:Uncharacterized protein n=1 Tax=Daphnia magna TaxID=35525 RepID=A0A164MZC2_9CRUS|nr:Uncharacterized protein APZ42_031287 [Daphnia magna]
MVVRRDVIIEEPINLSESQATEEQWSMLSMNMTTMKIGPNPLEKPERVDPITPLIHNRGQRKKNSLEVFMEEDNQRMENEEIGVAHSPSPTTENVEKLGAAHIFQAEYINDHHHRA